MYKSRVNGWWKHLQNLQMRKFRMRRQGWSKFDNFFTNRNQIIQSKQVAILVVAKIPRMSVVDLDVLGQGQCFREINHPHAGTVFGVNNQQTTANDFVFLEKVWILKIVFQCSKSIKNGKTDIFLSKKKWFQSFKYIVAFLNHVKVLVVFKVFANLIGK